MSKKSKKNIFFQNLGKKYQKNTLFSKKIEKISQNSAFFEKTKYLFNLARYGKNYLKRSI